MDVEGVVLESLPGNAAKIRLLLDLVERRPTRVLDVGCGNLSLWAAVDERPEVVGVDVTLPQPRVEGIERMKASASDLPFGDGEFDAVVSTQMLDDVRDRTAVLRELRRVLAPAGTLFLTCDARDAPRSWRARARRVPRGPTRDELGDEARDAGFVVEILRRYGLRDLKAIQGRADSRARMLTLELEEAVEPHDARLWTLLYLRARAGSASPTPKTRAGAP
jgi:SAM-dependent methyltransferase